MTLENSHSSQQTLALHGRSPLERLREPDCTIGQPPELIGEPTTSRASATYDFEVTFATAGENADLKDFFRSSQQFLPFQLPGWCKAWQKSVGALNSVRPVTVTVQQGRDIVAVMPLALQCSSFMGILTWHAENLSDYGAPALSGEGSALLAEIDIENLLREVAQQIGGVDLICLSKQPARLGGLANPFVLPWSVEHHVSAHALILQPGESFDGFMARTRGVSTRQQLRKKQRNLAKLGAIAFKIATTGAEANRYIEHCLDAKSKQLARLGHFDPFKDATNRAFVIDYFASNAGVATWAVALTLDGEPVASAFGFGGKRDWLIYQMAMDCDRIAHTSPGTQMLLHIIEHCIVKGIPRLDLAMGDEGYKMEWCNEHQTLYTTILPISVKGHLGGGIFKLFAVASKWIARQKPLYDLAKSVKRKLLKFRTRN